MSQSTSWADNAILAMVPLGIITAVVGAIRVGGPQWLRAMIGRARESRAIVETELMSSTSNEVCELWNGEEVVRIMGEGPIREFIILLPESYEKNDSIRSSQDGSRTNINEKPEIKVMDLSEDNKYLRQKSTYTPFRANQNS
jgi:hypothetical protein